MKKSPIKPRKLLKKFGNKLKFDQRFARGYQWVAGVDEVGRGCLAGPVCAGAVIFPPHLVIPHIDDSKKLSPEAREDFYREISEKALCWAVASVSPQEIDQINIHHASLKAMSLAISQLSTQPEFVLVDGKFPIPSLKTLILQKPIIKGDGLSQAIAAASIMAKVSRDRWMREVEKEYPQFQFGRHKGYGTSQHRDEIKQYGLTPLHRRSFKCFGP